MRAGLRIDVDTYRGTKTGVPRLCRVLQERGIRATFFFSVGPDNMGRHLWRLLRPAFLLKMLRSRAASLYGWDILLKGVFWPGPRIGERLAPVIRVAAEAGHEIGVHAWDHHAWQARIDRMGEGELEAELCRGYDELAGILGRPPTCSAAPGWKANERVLRGKAAFPFTFNSDCRGTSVFVPEVDGAAAQIQVPVTLPTYDEVIGRDGITDENYNQSLLDRFKGGRLNVLAIHAEVEGGSRLDLFETFLDQARDREIEFVPLGDIAAGFRPDRGRILPGSISGREGWVAVQHPAGRSEA